MTDRPSLHIGLVVETNDAERVWNAFRFATAGLDAGHTVETFLLGDGVEAPDIEHESINPHGAVIQYLRRGGALAACGSCLDARGLDPGDLRPRSDMATLVRIVEDSDRCVTVG